MKNFNILIFLLQTFSISAIDSSAEILKNLKRSLITATVIKSGEMKGTSISFSPDGSKYITYVKDLKKVLLCSANDSRELLEIKTSRPNRTTWSPDSKKVIIQSGHHKQMFDTQSGKELIKFEEMHMYDFVWSPDGASVAGKPIQDIFNWHLPCFIKVWDEEGNVRMSLSAEATCGLQFSADNLKLLIPYEDKCVYLFDVLTQQEIMRFDGHTETISKVKFYEHGAKLLTASNDHTARSWDVSNGKEIIRFNGHTEELTDFDVNKQEIKIVTASWDKTAKIWDLYTGEELITFKPHGTVMSVEFNHDGSLIVSAIWNSTVLLWDAQRGDQLAELYTSDFCLHGLGWNADGSKLFTSVYEGDSAAIWDVRSILINNILDHFWGEKFIESNSFLRQNALLVVLNAISRQKGGKPIYKGDLITDDIPTGFLFRDIPPLVKESLRYVFNINFEVFDEKLPLIRKTKVDRSL